MTEIIHLDSDQEPRISTAVLADGFGLEHKWMMDTIEKYSSDFITLGNFEEGKEILIRGLKPTLRNKKSRVLFLNEAQVNFLGTLTNNNERTVSFKLRLVMEFSKYQKILRRLLSNQNTASFVGALPEWKAIRRTLTDAIQDYNDYRVQRGIPKDEWIYSNITKLVNTQLFDFQDIEVGKGVNKRQLLTEKQRRKIADVEDDLVEIIIDNLEDPYKKVKEYLEMRMTHLKKSVVIDDQLRLK